MIDINTDEGIRDALNQIAAWPRPDADASLDAALLDVKPSTENGQRTDSFDTAVPRRRNGHRQRRSRRLLVAVCLLATLVMGAGVVAVSRGQTTEAANEVADGLDAGTVFNQCLDIESDFDLEPIRSFGTLHLLEESDGASVTVILDNDGLHVACGLTRRSNGHWRRAVSLAAAHLVLSSGDNINIVNAVEIGGQLFTYGQAGSSVSAVEVAADGSIQAASMSEGWWGASFDTPEAMGHGFPVFEVAWETDSRRKQIASSSDLLPSNSFRLCVADQECRTARVEELVQLARGLPDSDQANILGDGVVTEDEYRQMLVAWGQCIGDATGLAVAFDNSGAFTIDGPVTLTQEAFDQCKGTYASFVIEAAGLLGVDQAMD